MAEAKLDITGDGRAAQAELDKLTRKIAGLTEQMRKLKEQGTSGAKDQSSSFDKMGMAISRVALQYVSVGAAAALVTSELRDQLQLQRELANFQTQAAGSQIKLLRNLGAVASEERAKVLQELAAISQRTGVTQQNLFAAAANAVSAKGGLTNMQALQFVETAARVAPEDVGELTAVAGGLLDTSSLTGVADPRRNLAFMTSLASRARVTDLRAVSQQLVPGAIGVQGFGGGPEESAALVATITSAMKDARGEMSATSAISFAQQLEKFLPKEDTFSFDAKGRRKLAVEGTGLDTVDQRIKALQEDNTLLERFLATATFEKKAIFPIRDILTKGSPNAQLFEQNIAELKAASRPEDADRFIAGIQGVPLQQVADLTRRREQIVEQEKLGQLGAGMQGSAYDTVSEVLAGAGHGRISRGYEQFLMYLRSSVSGQTPAEVGAERLEQMQYSRLQQTEEGRAQLQALREAAALLRSIDRRQQGRKNVDAHVE